MNDKCDFFRDNIAELVSGSLNENQAKETREHINQCDECAEFEKLLRNEEELLNRLFESFNTDMERQQAEVIKAIECMELSTKEKLINKVQMVIDHPITKITAAAAVVLIVTFNGIRAINWLYELQQFMDVCSITPK